MIAYFMLYGLVVIWFRQADSLLLEPRARCVPTATAYSSCHICVCSIDGEYHCRARPCQEHPNENDKLNGERECEPKHTYRDDGLFCTCSDDGFWKSTNCRDKFNKMAPKTIHHLQKLRTNIACTPKSLYLLDCNICVCGKNGVIELFSCTNRQCTKASKVDICTYGDIVRTDNEICACSDIDLYIDRLCFKVSNKSIHEIERKDVESIIDIGRSWTRTNDIYGAACTPHTVLRVDCNRCICTSTKVLACTSKQCITPHSIVLRTKPTNTFLSLPKLESVNSPCEPNKQYRFKCNTCVCSLKGIPSCTTMICLQDYVLDKKVLEATMLE